MNYKQTQTYKQTFLPPYAPAYEHEQRFNLQTNQRTQTQSLRWVYLDTKVV